MRDVIAKTFTEDRNWDPDRGDLFMWLKWVIKSEVSHLARSASNRKDVRLDSPAGDGLMWDEIGIRNDRSSRVRLQVGSPEEAIMAVETDEEGKFKIDALLEACSGRPELEEIVYAISEGNCSAKPQELSEYLGKPVEEINQHLRSLRRRASKIRNEAVNEPE